MPVSGQVALVLSMNGKDWSFSVNSGGLEKSAYTVDVAKGKELRYIFSTFEEAAKYNGVFSFPVSVSGLDCYYQDELTEEENKTAYRPIDVVHSYACFDKSGKKVMHIYRSALLDASGVKVWCDMKLDTEQGLLSVLWDVKVLEGLVFPVVVDPTFGYTSIGASMDTYWVDGTSACDFELTETGTVSKVSFYVKANSGSFNTITAIYTKDEYNHPNTRVAVSSTVSISTTATWYNYTFDIELTAAHYYLALSQADTGLGNVVYYYDSGVSGQNQRRANVFCPDPFGTIDDSQAYKLSCFATYSGGDSYVLTQSIVNPENTTYTDVQIPLEVSVGGNDTNVVTTWNVQYPNASWMHVSNQTYSGITHFHIDENLTGVLFCAASAGDNCVNYTEVYFSVVYHPFELTLEYVFNISLLMGLLSFTGAICFVLVAKRRNE